MLLPEAPEGASLRNAKILSVTAHENERVIDFRFENFNELGNRVILVLSLELMGKHSNMFFYDDIQQVILGVAHSVSEQMSQHRELTAGLPYAPPPKPAGKIPLSSLTRQEFVARLAVVSKDQWPDVLNQWLTGWGKLILSDAVSQADSAESLYTLLSRLKEGENLKPSLSQDGKRFSLLQPDDGWQALDAVSETVRRYFMNQLVEKRLGSFRQRLSSAITAQQSLNW